MNDEEFVEEVTARLDDLKGVPSQSLFDLVTREGVCMWVDLNIEEPTWSGDNTVTDRELAANICRGCSVADESLELEFRAPRFTSLGPGVSAFESGAEVLGRIGFPRGRQDLRGLRAGLAQRAHPQASRADDGAGRWATAGRAHRLAGAHRHRRRLCRPAGADTSGPPGESATSPSRSPRRGARTSSAPHRRPSTTFSALSGRTS